MQELEIYKDLSLPKSKEFEKLLNIEFSKPQVSEGTMVEGTITKITSKLVFVDCGGKSEGSLDINEMRILKEEGSLKVNSKINVLIVKQEDRHGDLIISREKCVKMLSWKKLQNAFEENKVVSGMIISKCKGGFICEVQSTLCFLPGSQVALTNLKSVSHLMKEPQEFLIVKVDKVRGNIVISRRALLEKIQSVDKEEIIKKYKIGDVVEGVVKGITDYGIFFDLDGKIDCMCHINHASWSRINHPSELFSLNQRQKLKIIDINIPSKKISVSCKELVPDPFETKINSYSEGQIVENCEVIRVLDYGAFVRLEENLEGLVHSSMMSYTKKDVSPKKIVSVTQRVTVKILAIEKSKRRISLSIKDCQPNPWKKFKEECPINSNCDAVVASISDFAIFADIKGYGLRGMCHRNDLDWDLEKQDLRLFKKGDQITAKVLEVDEDKEKIKIGVKQILPDPLDYFKDKKKRDIITVIVLEALDNVLKVSPEGCPMKILIKKNQISIEKQNQRTNRFNRGDKVDVMIQTLNLKTREIQLSIKMLEDAQNKEIISRYGSVDSGKSLPFADLSKTLKKKSKEEEK